MTTLTFYGAVNEIGGNKILLQDKKTSKLVEKICKNILHISF